MPDGWRAILSPRMSPGGVAKELPDTQLTDLLTGAARFHYAAILLITIAFATRDRAQPCAAESDQAGFPARRLGARAAWVQAVAPVRLARGEPASFCWVRGGVGGDF